MLCLPKLRRIAARDVAFRPALLIAILMVASVLLEACAVFAGPLPRPTTSSPPLAEELIFYDWEEDMPESVLDAFTAEYGTRVTYLPFDSMQEAETNIEEGRMYDVAVLENAQVARLAAAGLLAEIDFVNVPNFAHIAPNFKNLVHDRNNKHSIPFNWGTTGLVVRSDLVDELPTRWADLWDPRYAGKVALREEMLFDAVGLTLKSLGYSINTENAGELATALDRLLELKPNVVMASVVAPEAISRLLSGEITVMVGWATDVQEGRKKNEAIVYVLPEEGSMLWGDNFVIPANSPHKDTAEVFLNFLLRPEISAQIINENHYAMANEAAYPLIDPQIRDDPVIFPAQEQLVNGEVFLPLSDEGYELWINVWEIFVNGSH